MSSSAAVINLVTRQGNTEEIRFTLMNGEDLFDPTGSEFYFRCESHNGSVVIEINTVDDPSVMFVDDLTSVLTLKFTKANTRLMSVGATNFYEIERRIGDSERTIIEGTITVGKGRNADA